MPSLKCIGIDSSFSLKFDKGKVMFILQKDDSFPECYSIQYALQVRLPTEEECLRFKIKNPK